jgi:quercetin dioxygenase-like cupin family protein
MDTQTFEAALKADRYDEIVTVDKPPGYAMGEHRHAFDARALITSGDITLVVDGVARRYSAGQIFELAAGTPHDESAGVEGVTYRVGRREVVRA